MKIRTAELVNNLNLQYSIYQQLYELGREKQQVVISEDLARLEEIRQNEEKFLGKIEGLERERQELSLAQNISAIIKQLDRPNKDKLLKIQQDLLKLLGLLQEQNNLNDRLIKDALQLTNMDLNILTNNNQPPTYDKNNKLQTISNPKNLLDRQA